jgi:ParB family chromosome partitioning protein
MAARAAVLLESSGWLPEPLRTPGRALPEPVESEAESPVDDVIVENAIDGEGPTAEDDGARSVADEAPLSDNDMVEGDTPFAVAAE